MNICFCLTRKIPVSVPIQPPVPAVNLQGRGVWAPLHSLQLLWQEAAARQPPFPRGSVHSMLGGRLSWRHPSSWLLQEWPPSATTRCAHKVPWEMYWVCISSEQPGSCSTPDEFTGCLSPWHTSIALCRAGGPLPAFTASTAHSHHVPVCTSQGAVRRSGCAAWLLQPTCCCSCTV